jgi:hypothetical protein
MKYRIHKGFATLSLHIIIALTLFITKIYFQFSTSIPQLKILGEAVVFWMLEFNWYILQHTTNLLYGSG